MAHDSDLALNIEPVTYSPTQAVWVNLHRQAEADYRQHLRSCTRCKTGKAETCSARIQLYRQAENAERRAINAGVPL